MGAKIKGSIKVKAEKDFKKGDEIELSDVTFDADQEDFEAALEPRLKRERKKISEAEERAEKAEKALADAEKAGKEKGGEVDSKTAERLEKLEAENKSLQLKMKVESAIKKAGVELPEQFRNAISLKPNASDDAIEEAVKDQVKAFNDLKKSLGAPEKAQTEEEKAAAKAAEAAKKPGNGLGNQGQGDPPQTPQQKQDLERLMNLARQFVPGQLTNLENLDDAGKLDVLSSWEANKMFEAKK